MVGRGRYYSPPEVDRIWGIRGCSYNIPKAIFCLVKGNYRGRTLNRNAVKERKSCKGSGGLAAMNPES